MRAKEFTKEEPKIRFADGYIKFSDHFEDRLLDHNIDKREVLQMLHKLEVMRSVDLIKMPFVPFVVRSPNLSLAVYKQLDKSRNTAYVVATAHRTLKAGEDEDVIYLEEDDSQSAAGIVLYAEDTGRYGLQQRSDRINDGGLWAAWGGGREPGESLEQCARRELAEESGYTGPVKLTRLGENPRYVTFLGVVPHEFEPRPDDEWQDYCWVEAGDWPSPMHPGVTAALKNIPVDEGLKSKLAGAALAGGMALGAGGAHAMDWKDAAMTGAMFVPGIGQVAKAYNVGSNLWNAAKAAKQYKTLGKEIDAIAAKQAAQPKQSTTVAYDPDNADKFEPVDENFADGKVKGKSRPGRVKRAGASCDGSVTSLRAKAKKYGGEKGKMYHWCANMKSGRKK